jgi:hypothetical protein
VSSLIGISAVRLISSDPFALVDGSLGAPAGVPQFSTLLSGYVARPPWRVAGVDYHVGIDRNLFPTNAILADPLSGASPSAAFLAQAPSSTYSGGAITVLDSNVTIQGFDFSLHNGVSLIVDPSTSNVTIKNNNFELGTNNGTSQGFAILATNNFTPAPAGGCNNLTIVNNEINGHGDTVTGQVGTGLLQLNTQGALIVRYNFLQKAYAESVVCGQNLQANPATSYTFQYNIFKDDNYGSGAGAHGDIIAIQVNQSFIPTLTTFTADWNLLFQTLRAGGSGTQGISWQNGSNITNWSTQNNTVVANGQVASLNEGVTIDTTGALANTGQVANNYFDPTGIGVTTSSDGNYWIYSNIASGGFDGTGNINMLNGAVIGRANITRGAP